MEFIATGKNIEKAIANGLEQINAKFEDVDVEIISEGGIFSKAKVKIIYGDKEPLPQEPIEVKKQNLKIASKNNDEETDGITVSLKKEKKDKVEPVEENKNEKQETVVEKIENKENRVNNNKPAVEFLKDVLSLTQTDGEITKEENEEYINISINGENLSGIIGNKGECLSALQYVLSLVKSEEEKGKKIILDAGNYKKNREDKIREITTRLIEKVKESGRWEKLKPMTAYERRIAHEVINETDGVYGESRGEEPYRYLTIYPKKD